MSGVCDDMMRCVVAMLQDGLAGKKNSHDYIKSKAKALSAYDLTPVEEDWYETLQEFYFSYHDLLDHRLIRFAIGAVKSLMGLPKRLYKH